MQKCEIIEMLSKPDFKGGWWWVKVKVKGYGMELVEYKEFEFKDEAEKISVGDKIWI